MAAPPTTHILFIPHDNQFLALEYPGTCEELLRALREDTWQFPAPYQNIPFICLSQAKDLLVLAVKPQPPASAAHPRRLTRRQHEVLGALAEGLTSEQIAARLFLSPRTVYQHIGALKKIFAASTRAQMISRAIEWGLL